MAGIECPDCRAQLENVEWVEIDIPGREASKFTYQWWSCPECGLLLYATLEEFIDVFDDDLVHNGYRTTDEDAWTDSMLDAAECPDKRNRKCGCRVHKLLREQGFPGLGDRVPMNIKKD